MGELVIAGYPADYPDEEWLSLVESISDEVVDATRILDNHRDWSISSGDTVIYFFVPATYYVSRMLTLASDRVSLEALIEGWSITTQNFCEATDQLGDQIIFFDVSRPEDSLDSIQRVAKEYGIDVNHLKTQVVNLAKKFEVGNGLNDKLTHLIGAILCQSDARLFASSNRVRQVLACQSPDEMPSDSSSELSDIDLASIICSTLEFDLTIGVALDLVQYFHAQEKSLFDYKRKNTALEDKISHARKQLTTVRAHNSASNEAISKDMHYLAERHKTLTTRLDSINAEKKELETLNSSLKDEKDKLEAQKKKLEALNGSFKGEKDKLETQKKELETLNSSLKGEKDKLETQKKELETLNSSLKDEKDKLEAQKKKLEALNGSFKGEKDKLETQKKELETLNSSLKGEKDKLETQKKELETRFSESKGKVEELSAQLTRMEAGLKVDRKPVESSEEVSLLKSQLEHVQSQLEDYFSKFHELDQRHASTTNIFYSRDALPVSMGSISSLYSIGQKGTERFQWDIQNLSFADEKFSLIRIIIESLNNQEGLTLQNPVIVDDDGAQQPGILTSAESKFIFLQRPVVLYNSDGYQDAIDIGQLSGGDFIKLTRIVSHLVREVRLGRIHYGESDSGQNEKKRISNTTLALVDGILEKEKYVLRWDDSKIKSTHVLDNYEQLWFELSTVPWRNSVYDFFDFKLEASGLFEGDGFGFFSQYLHLSFRSIEELVNPFDAWPPTVADSHGEILVISIDLIERRMYLPEGEFLSSSDTALVVEILRKLPVLIERSYDEQVESELNRPASHWLNSLKVAISIVSSTQPEKNAA